MKNSTLFIAFFFALLFTFSNSYAEVPNNAEIPKIQDNSFFIEEAYNQEDGVIQHIQGYRYNNDGTWQYVFSQEWPVPKRANQLSYTIPVYHLKENGTDTDLGDIYLNYRRQLVYTKRVALAPRFSVIFPTGDYKHRFGSGTYSMQVNIPLSIELSDKWVTHLNAGATFAPKAKGPAGSRANTIGCNVGASLIWLALENFNPMLEAVYATDEYVLVGNSTDREHAVLINPGFRTAINFKSGLQIVPGLSFPIGVGPSSDEYGVLFYLSFEHPLF